MFLIFLIILLIIRSLVIKRDDISYQQILDNLHNDSEKVDLKSYIKENDKMKYECNNCKSFFNEVVVIEVDNRFYNDVGCPFCLSTNIDITEKELERKNKVDKVEEKKNNRKYFLKTSLPLIVLAFILAFLPLLLSSLIQ